MEVDIVQDLRAKLSIATEALRRAEERALPGQFALEVMHEVRNPLEAMGYLLHLASGEDDPKAVREYLRQANEQMATVHQIAAQTLGFARMLPTPQEVDLVELAEAALRIHHRRITAQKIHLVRDFTTATFAEVYTGEILQVVSNLLANALDALPEGGTVSLRLRKRGAQVQLLVADNGKAWLPITWRVCLSHSSQRKKTEERGWDSHFPRRSSSAMLDGSPLEAAHYPVEVARLSGSPCLRSVRRKPLRPTFEVDVRPVMSEKSKIRRGTLRRNGRTRQIGQTTLTDREFPARKSQVTSDGCKPRFQVSYSPSR